MTSSDTPSEKKKKKRSTIPSIFSTAGSWVRVQASVCPCVTTVSCDVAMTTDYAQRDLLEEGKKKNQPPVTESGESRCELSGLQISVLWGKRESKKEIYVENKKGGHSHTTPQNSVISTTGPLIISARPVTALWNTSAWREVRPETVASLPSPHHHRPVKSPLPWLNGMPWYTEKSSVTWCLQSATLLL